MWVSASGHVIVLERVCCLCTGILQEAMGRGEYWRLVDSSGRPPGLLGMWPSRAVTFVENHDTGACVCPVVSDVQAYEASLRLLHHDGHDGHVLSLKWSVARHLHGRATTKNAMMPQARPKAMLNPEQPLQLDHDPSPFCGRVYVESLAVPGQPPGGGLCVPPHAPGDAVCVLRPLLGPGPPRAGRPEAAQSAAHQRHPRSLEGANCPGRPTSTQLSCFDGCELLRTAERSRRQRH